MNVLNHREHAAGVEGRGYEGSGDSVTYVPTVGFEYPDDGEPETSVVRDQWRDEPLYRKCQRRFVTVPSGDVMTMPLLDKRLDVLQFALREAVEQMDVSAICRLAEKARSTTERMKAERVAEASPSTRETHGDILILDDADRGKVVVHFAEPVDRNTRRWLQICGFSGCGDGASFWRRRTFRRGENIGLENARHCVARVLEDRAKLEAAGQPVEEPVTATADPFGW